MKQIETLDDGRLVFVVSLVPRASRSEVIGWSDAGHLKIRVTAPPVDDAANQQLIKFLAKTLDVQRRQVTITSGTRSRHKTLNVPNTCKNRLLSFVDI
jgi:uncharacterized protein (TIGR00251 family)